MLVGEAIRLDPTNTHAILVKKQLDGNVIRVAAAEGELVTPPAADADPNSLRLVGPPPANPPAPATPAGDQPGALLNQSDQLLQVRIGQIVADVNRELQRSRDRVSQDPSGVKQNLQLMRENVLHAPELPADIRAQLRESIDGVMQLANVREREQSINTVQAQQQQALALENQRLQESMNRGQQRLKQLLERMNYLLSEGRYAEAESDAAAEAVRNRPGFASRRFGGRQHAVPELRGAQRASSRPHGT